MEDFHIESLKNCQNVQDPLFTISEDFHIESLKTWQAQITSNFGFFQTPGILPGCRCHPMQVHGHHTTTWVHIPKD